jgi:hypothetical protein
MKKLFISLSMLAFAVILNGQAETKTKHLILVTLDGFRWQEVFNGADSSMLHNKLYTENGHKADSLFWSDDLAGRRNKLLPFFWNEIALKGQIYGNRNKGCMVNVRNPYWFSYPGYNELLTGFADIRINSNEFGPNPNSNFMEFLLSHSPQFKDKIAVFASWNAFNDIINEKRNHILVNCGLEKLPENGLSPEMKTLNIIQDQLPDIFDGVRLDGVTFFMGINYLKTTRPKILYLAFDETDDFAHGGKYDLYLNSAHYEDGFLRQIWQWIQNDPEYKDNTTLFITCDHGRGTDAEWKDHGSKVVGSSETWFAVIGPDTPAAGEIKSGQFYTNQFAATLVELLGFQYESASPVGQTLKQVLGR